MTLEIIRDTLGWCAVLNIGLLLWWVGFIALAGDWVYRTHNNMLPVTREQFNGIHYGGIAIYKIAIFMLNIVPYLALRIVG